MGCQHGNGYQRCQDCKSKLLHTGHFAPIEHTNRHSKHPSTSPSPSHPLHHSDSSPQHPCATHHTRITHTPQSLSQGSILTTTHLSPIIDPVTPPYLFLPHGPQNSFFLLASSGKFLSAAFILSSEALFDLSSLKKKEEVIFLHSNPTIGEDLHTNILACMEPIRGKVSHSNVDWEGHVHVALASTLSP
jgi:hypothetical protein